MVPATAYLPYAPSNFSESYMVHDFELGRGCAGVVRTCKEQSSGKQFACKSIRKTDKPLPFEVETVRNEVDALRDLSGNRYIVSLKQVYEDTHCVHLVEEHCDGGDLFDETQSKSGCMMRESEARYYFWQILQGVAACHAKGWLHRDLKLENIMLCNKPCGEEGEGASTDKGGIVGAKGERKQDLRSDAARSCARRETHTAQSSQRGGRTGWCTYRGADEETAEDGRDPSADPPPEASKSRSRAAFRCPSGSSSGKLISAFPKPNKSPSPYKLVKIIDFGLAIHLSGDEKATGQAGSFHYMAPEVIRRKAYDFKADMWSLGVILYSMLVGCFPFCGEVPSAITENILEGKVNYQEWPWPRLSIEARDVVTRLLQRKPKRRPTAEELLRHPWFAGMATAEKETQMSPKKALRVASEEGDGVEQGAVDSPEIKENAKAFAEAAASLLPVAEQSLVTEHARSAKVNDVGDFSFPVDPAALSLPPADGRRFSDDPLPLPPGRRWRPRAEESRSKDGTTGKVSNVHAVLSQGGHNAREVSRCARRSSMEEETVAQIQSALKRGLTKALSRRGSGRVAPVLDSTENSVEKGENRLAVTKSQCLKSEEDSVSLESFPAQCMHVASLLGIWSFSK